MQRDRIIRYVLERHCKEQGGFCFYRLEEPSGADTYYSLWILNALKEPFADERTVAYLQNMQHADGSYESVFSAFYSIKGLRLLRQQPTHNPSPYIHEKLKNYSIEPENLPAEIISIFRRLLFLVEVYVCLESRRDFELEKNIAKVLLNFRNADHGFGHIRSNLVETAQALNILKQLDFPVSRLRAEKFIALCETPVDGFTDVPGATLSYIEHIHAGLLSCSISGLTPGHATACEDFLKNCQRRNGGFSRTVGEGIATLENSFYAIQSLRLLNGLI